MFWVEVSVFLVGKLKLASFFQGKVLAWGDIFFFWVLNEGSDGPAQIHLSLFDDLQLTQVWFELVDSLISKWQNKASHITWRTLQKVPNIRHYFLVQRLQFFFLIWLKTRPLDSSWIDVVQTFCKDIKI